MREIVIANRHPRLRIARPAILRAIQQQDPTLATGLLNSHITASKAEVRKITLHKLHTAREQMARDMEIA